MDGIWVPVLAFLSVTSLGSGFLLARSARRESLRSRLRPTEGGAGRVTKAQLLEGLARIGNTFSSSKASSKLRADLERAVSRSRSAVSVYLGTKVIFFFVGAAVGITLFLFLSDLPLAHGVLLAVVSGTVLFFLPNLYVRWCRKVREEQVRRHLPDAVDLLEICVSAGMGLDMTWNAVAEEFRPISSILSDEMTLTNLEMHLGIDRGTALRRMAQRTGSHELSSLVAVLVQTERFGTSVADALKVFATSMRDLRSDRAEESAEKMATKLLFPLILLIFPSIMVVAVGPAVLMLMDSLFAG